LFRKAANLAEEVEGLSQFSGVRDFTTYTYSIISKCKDLLSALAESPTEGYSREIIRLLRNTFLEQGWEKYRQPQKRKAAIQVLRMLASSSEVGNEQLMSARKLMNNLDSAGVKLPEWYDEENTDDEATGS
jgi:hypothetical protein